MSQQKNEVFISHLDNLVLRVLRLLGQRVVARRDSPVLEFLPQNLF